MVRRFWVAISWVAVVVTAFTWLSWFYLYLNHVPLSKPASTLQLINLPTTAPSVWNTILPIVSKTWLLPIVVLLLQVFLTGGFYGTLVRVNTGRAASAGSFVSDSLHAYWRLLLWNIMWELLSLLVIGIYKMSSTAAIGLSILLVCLRYVFLFADVALVCELQSPMRTALANAGNVLLNQIVPMLPYGVSTVVFTGVAMTVTAYGGTFTLLWVGVAYGLVMTWLGHLVTARYLAYSAWSATRADEATSRL